MLNISALLDSNMIGKFSYLPSLIDISSKNVITVDTDSLVLRLEIGSVAKETRLKKYHGKILCVLFQQHPKSLVRSAKLWKGEDQMT
jgi:hypothetical protein